LRLPLTTRSSASDMLRQARVDAAETGGVACGRLVGFRDLAPALTSDAVGGRKTITRYQ
jgi:hypothetical protein